MNDSSRLLIAIDQGTSSSRTVIYDDSAEVVSSSQKEFAQIYPKPGWVEHDPDAIWQSQLEVASAVLASPPKSRARAAWWCASSTEAAVTFDSTT